MKQDKLFPNKAEEQLSLAELEQSSQENCLNDDIEQGIIERFPTINDGYYELRADGVFFVAPKTKSNPDETEEIKVCEPLRVKARTISTDRERFGKLLEWHDYNGKIHKMTVKNSQIQSNAVEIRGELADQGLGHLRAKSPRDYLQDYLNSANPDNEIYLADKLGWYKNPTTEKYSYVLPEKTIGDAAETVIFNNRNVNMEWIKKSGTLGEWRKQIATPARTSSRCVFAISTVFAAPLLDICDGYVDSRIFEFGGNSSTRKTFALLFAQSVLGYRQKLPNWRATANGLERMALAHNDCTIFLDEIGVADKPNQVPQYIYLLCGGSARIRSNTSLTVNKIENWGLLGLATGEVSLKQLAIENNFNVKAGQEIRLVNIPADARKGFGIFDAVPEGFRDLDELSKEISTAFRCQYGTAFESWVKRLVQLRNMDTGKTLKEEIIKQVDAFVKDAFSGKKYSDQILRVAKTFGLVAVAGDLASGNKVPGLADGNSPNITGWRRSQEDKRGRAWRAALRCFKAWLREFGASKLSKEDQDIIDNAKLIFATHGSRFCAEDEKQAPNNQIGWTNKIYSVGLTSGAEDTYEFEYYVESTNYKKYFCRGTEVSHVDAVLTESGILVAKKKYIHPKSVGGDIRRVRVLKSPRGG